MKSLKDMLNESLLPKDERELKKLGFKKQVEGREIWFEMTYKDNLIRIMQEEVGDNNWWMAKVESYYVLNADNKPCTYETPLEAAYEALDTVDDWTGKERGRRSR